MIRSFKSKALKLLATKGDPSKLKVPNVARVELILALLDAAESPQDMAVPGLDLHQLKGARRGTYSVSVSGNYRITFEFEDGHVTRVELEDYH